ncbi:MAG: oligosaccharide flippase family protein [Bacillus sp. (in: firmicutes)]
MDLVNKFFKYASGSFVTLLVGLAATPIITRLISTETMGKYSMFVTIGGLLASFLFLGLDQSFVRFFYEEKEEKRIYLLTKCIRFPLIVAFFVCFILLIFNKKVSLFIVGESSLVTVIILCVYMVCLVLSRFTSLFLRMKQRAVTYSLLNTSNKLFYLILALVFFYYFFGDNELSLIIAISISEFLFLSLCIFNEKKEYASLVHIEQIVTRDKDLLKYGYPFIFSNTIFYILQSTDKIMLNIFADYNQIGLFSGAQNIVNLLSQVQNVFTLFWVPVAYERYLKFKEDRDFFRNVNEMVSYGMLVCAIVLLCFKDTIVLFLGPSYADAVYIFPFLIFMPIMYTISETTVLGINFKKKSHYHVVIAAITATSNILANFVLINFYGAKGAAIATGLSYIVFFGLRTYFSQKLFYIEYPLKRFSIVLVSVYILAIIATFSKVNLIFIVIAFVIFLFISILYKDMLIKNYQYIKTTFKQKSKKN